MTTTEDTDPTLAEYLASFDAPDDAAEIMALAEEEPDDVRSRPPVGFDRGDTTVEAPPRQFAIETEGLANWALYMLTGAQDAIDAAEAEAAEQRARIDDWLGRRTAKARRTASFFTVHLLGYFRHEQEEAGIDPKTGVSNLRSLPLRAGTPASRKSTTVQVIDEAALLAFCKDEFQDAVVRPEPSVDLATVKKAMDLKALDAEHRPVSKLKTGQAVPGVQVVLHENPSISLADGRTIKPPAAKPETA